MIRAILTTLALLATGLLPAGPVLASGDHGSHEHHGDMNGHMERMVQTRNGLMKKLGDEYDAPVRPPKPGELEKGKQVYMQYCASCHGPSGKGDGPAGKTLQPPAADLTDPMHARFYSDRGRLEIIRSGSPGTAMPAWQNSLSEEDLMAVYQYVRSLRPSGSGMMMASMEHGDHGEQEHDGQEHAHDMSKGHAEGDDMMHRLEATDGVLQGRLEPVGALATAQKAKLLLHLRDTSGAPVQARRVRIRWSMPAMGHDLKTVTAIPQREAGVYRVSLMFPMKGHYRAETQVELPDGSTHKLVFELMVP